MNKAVRVGTIFIRYYPIQPMEPGPAGKAHRKSKYKERAGNLI